MFTKTVTAFLQANVILYHTPERRLCYPVCPQMQPSHVNHSLQWHPYCVTDHVGINVPPNTAALLRQYKKPEAINNGGGFVVALVSFVCLFSMLYISVFFFWSFSRVTTLFS